MTYPQLLQQKQFMLLDCISGSTAYNLNVPGSDVDKKGIFILPQQELYGFDFTDQVANESNDEVYFEIKRFLELLTKNNPNILELLSTPTAFVLYRHPLMDLIKPEDFLSKLCLDTFAGYAQTQIKKAKGLNKKINWPLAHQRKTVSDFCYLANSSGAVPLNDWLKTKGLLQPNCGLVKLDHFRDAYLLYYQDEANHFRGIVSGPEADDVQVSQVPKGMDSLAVMHFNKDAYSVYCREYREHKEWEEKRNEARFQNTLSQGKNYDAKNMMHTFRLLNMAEEIALHQKVMVNRHDRDFLLSIRNGAFEFDELMQMVENKMDRIKELYAKSALPDKPDEEMAKRLLIRIREEFYER